MPKTYTKENGLCSLNNFFSRFDEDILFCCDYKTKKKYGKHLLFISVRSTATVILKSKRVKNGTFTLCGTKSYFHKIRILYNGSIFL